MDRCKDRWTDVKTDRDHPYTTYAKKSDFLTLPPSKYASVHFGLYPPSLPVHAYGKCMGEDEVSEK